MLVRTNCFMCLINFHARFMFDISMKVNWVIPCSVRKQKPVTGLQPITGLGKTYSALPARVQRQLPVHTLEACQKVRRLCHRHNAECGRPLAEPHRPYHAGKLRVHHAQSGFYRQAGAGGTPEYLRPPDVLYHQCGSWSWAYQSGQFSCSLCNKFPKNTSLYQLMTTKPGESV